MNTIGTLLLTLARSCNGISQRLTSPTGGGFISSTTDRWRYRARDFWKIDINPCLKPSDSLPGSGNPTSPVMVYLFGELHSRTKHWLFIFTICGMQHATWLQLEYNYTTDFVPGRALVFTTATTESGPLALSWFKYSTNFILEPNTDFSSTRYAICDLITAGPPEWTSSTPYLNRIIVCMCKSTDLTVNSYLINIITIQ